MEGLVDLWYVGRMWERDPLLVWIWLETPLRRWNLYESIFSRLRAGRISTPTDDGDLYSLRWEIMSS